MADPRPDPADDGQRDQEAEQRQAGNGLHGVGETKHPALDLRLPGEQDARRYGDGRRDEHRDPHQPEVLADAGHKLRLVLIDDFGKGHVRLSRKAAMRGSDPVRNS